MHNALSMETAVEKEMEPSLQSCYVGCCHFVLGQKLQDLGGQGAKEMTLILYKSVCILCEGKKVIG